MRRLFCVVAIGLSSLAIGISANPSPAAAALPLGFTDTVVPSPVGNPLDQPTTIIAMNAGRAMILEKTGKVRLMRSDGSISPADLLSLAVCSSSEMGLLGAALDPAFGVNGFVYLYYSHSTGNCATATGRANRVSRFTMSGETIDPASEKVLLDNIAATGGNHDGGDLEVGQDGYLYVSIGDAGTNPRGTSAFSAATDLSLLNGKIIRITTSGGVPADNPLVGDPNAISCAFGGLTTPTNRVCTEIFAWGLRNPYRFAFDPNAGNTRFFINDVGQNTTEEVDEGGIGRNYGWNSREGNCPTGQTAPCAAAPAGLTDPLTSYARPLDTACSYITAGAFVPNGVWPAQYDNTYLFADGGCGKIWTRTGSSPVDYATPFTTTTGGIVDMAFVLQGADPALYYVTNGDGQLHKITYDAPVASSSVALAFTPLASPARAYDTRYTVGTSVGMMRGGTTRLVDLSITDPNVKAALVNLTMVDPLGGGYLTASQPRTEHPSTSNVNAVTGEIVANASIVPVDSTGHLLLYTFVTTDVVVDVMGTFAAPGSSAAGRYTSVAPKRLVDTREPFDSATNNFTSTNTGGVVSVNAPVLGRAGVVPNVTAVAFIVTGLSTPFPNAGYVTVFPGHDPVPPSSNLNVNGSGDIRANLVVVPLGADGSIDLKLFATANVVVDVAGYVSSAPTGLYHVISPSRQVDTRTGLGFGTLAVNGTGTLHPGAPLPPSIAAVSQNVTITNPKTAGFVTAYPSDGVLPLASNGNSTAADQDRAAFSLTRVGGGGTGSISYYTSSGTDLVVDITGYFD